MACILYFARCMNIIFHSLLVQLVKYDVHTTRKIKSIHAIFITYFTAQQLLWLFYLMVTLMYYVEGCACHACSCFLHFVALLF